MKNILLIIFLLFSFSENIFSNENNDSLFQQNTNSNTIIKFNPFIFPTNNRAICGTNFNLIVKENVKKFILNNVFLTNVNKDTLSLEVEAIEYSSAGFIKRIGIKIPEWDENFRNKFSLGNLDGFMTSINFTIYFDINDSSKVSEIMGYDIELANPLSAFLWALLTIIIITGLGHFIIKYKANYTTIFNKKPLRIFEFPLQMTINKSNHFSLSLLQVVIWTYTAIFIAIYYWKLTQSFIDFPDEILIFLGISGSTGIISKLQVQRKIDEIPIELKKLISHENVPKLYDFIAVSSKPNIYKIQMLIFTIFIFGSVVKEVLLGTGIPDIPQSLLYLTGVSNFIFVGNNLSVPTNKEELKNINKIIKSKKDSGIELKNYLDNVIDAD